MIQFAGHVRLTAERRPGGRTALTEQSFRAPYHLSKPYWDVDAGTLLVQVVNPTAGILAGDRLESVIQVGQGASALITTPSASRVFAMDGGVAECDQAFRVDAGGWLEVSPEPLVPHRRSRYHQRTVIDVADGGGLFFVDQLLPGRIGHGEAWVWDELRLQLTVRVNGMLVLHECFAPAAEDLRDFATFAGCGESACFANAVLIADVQDPAPAWRAELEALHREGVWLGVSALCHPGSWTIRVVASGTIRLRETVRAIRSILAAPFPHVACDPRKL